MPKNFSTPFALSVTPFTVPFAMLMEAHAAVLKAQSSIKRCEGNANMIIAEFLKTLRLSKTRQWNSAKLFVWLSMAVEIVVLY